MSSICGIVDFEANTFDFERLRDMGRAMVLRGKDQSGAYIKSGVGFQHNRMIWSGGVRSRQPYTAVKGERAYTIVFDGELYNIGKISDLFGFCGFGSAAEAALECYIAFGYECVEQMDGAFAFAVYDEKSKEVFLARDSIGAKPLYYLNDGGRLVFASEIKGILRYLRDGVEADRAAVEELVRAPVGMIGGADIYRGIKELGESCFAVHSRLGTQVSEYRSSAESRGFFGREGRGEILCPSCEGKFSDIEALLHEILVAFDHPAFDEYMPEYIEAIKKSAAAKKATVCDRALLIDVAYALERADRIGMMNGVMVNIVPPDEERRERRSGIVKAERSLSDIGERILNDKESYIFKYFGNRIKEAAARERDARQRVRMYGRIIQTEQWLASYPILPV
ncbi:MAG: hypothetical protein J6A83_08345 [Clostridia bacterium]|nr:hypothetical protein [Clostridia bacterium]